ncbi:MAG: hypothetical protein ACXWCR_13695 [Flavitalea sp.]
MNNNLNDKSEAAQKFIKENSRNKTLMIIIIIAVVLIAAIWIWKNMQMKNEREVAKQEMKVVQDRATALMIDSHKEHLKLLAKPYVWAIRNELLSGNTNQVNVYANELVKEKNFQSIVVANDKGIVISSTNKKNEGKLFSSIGKPELITGNSTIVETLNDSILVMSSPVMGFNNRLGTLMITYKIDKPQF